MRERVLVHVVAGQVRVESRDETVSCGTGTLVEFEPGERHSLSAIRDARLLLLLAPWPAPGHYSDGEIDHTQYLPSNAVVEPVTSEDTPGALLRHPRKQPRRRGPNSYEVEPTGLAKCQASPVHHRACEARSGGCYLAASGGNVPLRRHSMVKAKDRAPERRGVIRHFVF